MTLQYKSFVMCTVKLYLCCTIPCKSTEGVDPILLTAALDRIERFILKLLYTKKGALCDTVDRDS
jgi:hypothetical protein